MCSALIEQTRKTNKAGVEMQFAANVLAYYLLMTELHPLLKQAAAAASSTAGAARVVNVASNYAGDLNIADIEWQKHKFDSNRAYRSNKQANRMLSHYAADLWRADKIVIHSCHPGVLSINRFLSVSDRYRCCRCLCGCGVSGVVTSNVLKSLSFGNGFNSAAEGAETPLHLALSNDKTVTGTTGLYWHDSATKNCPWKNDKAGQKTLWYSKQSLSVRAIWIQTPCALLVRAGNIAPNYNKSYLTPLLFTSIPPSIHACNFFILIVIFNYVLLMEECVHLIICPLIIH